MLDEADAGDQKWHKVLVSEALSMLLRDKLKGGGRGVDHRTRRAGEVAGGDCHLKKHRGQRRGHCHPVMAGKDVRCGRRSSVPSVLPPGSMHLKDIILTVKPRPRAQERV